MKITEFCKAHNIFPETPEAIAEAISAEELPGPLFTAFEALGEWEPSDYQPEERDVGIMSPYFNEVTFKVRHHWARNVASLLPENVKEFVLNNYQEQFLEGRRDRD